MSALYEIFKNITIVYWLVLMYLYSWVFIKQKTFKVKLKKYKLMPAYQILYSGSINSSRLTVIMLSVTTLVWFFSFSLTYF